MHFHTDMKAEERMGYLSTILSVSSVRKILYRSEKHTPRWGRDVVSLLIDGGDTNMGGGLRASSMRGR